MKNYVYVILAFFIFCTAILGAEKAPLGSLLKHASPIKNISLEYECETFSPGGLVSFTKNELCVDFENERLELFWLHKQAPNILIKKVLLDSGRVTFVLSNIPYKLENFSIESIKQGKPKVEHRDGRALLRPGAIGDGYDTLMGLMLGMYTESFSNLQKRGILNAISNTISVTFIDSQKRKHILSIDKNTGFLLSKEVFESKTSKDETLSYVRSEKYGKIKQEIIHGVLIPTEFEIEVQAPAGLDYNSDAPMEVRLLKVKVKKDSIKINQDLKNKRFELKIPVGYLVTDEIRKLSYYADGLAKDGSQEKLSDALEATFQEAERQRREVQSQEKKGK